MRYTCSLNLYCHEPAFINVYGRGFADAGSSNLLCRINGVTVQATTHNLTSMSCYSPDPPGLVTSSDASQGASIQAQVIATHRVRASASQPSHSLATLLCDIHFGGV